MFLIFLLICSFSTNIVQTLFTQCGLIRSAFDVQQAQQKTLEGFFALSQRDDEGDAAADTNALPVTPKLSDALISTCTKYSKNCWMLLEKETSFRNSIVSHDGGQDLLTDLAVKVLYGPLTDIAIAAVDQVKKYKAIGYEEVPNFGSHKLSVSTCVGLEKAVCELREDACKWAAETHSSVHVCSSKTKSQQYTMMSCRGCTNAKPILWLSFNSNEPLAYSALLSLSKEPLDESYLYERGKNLPSYVKVRRSEETYNDISDQFVTSIICGDKIGCSTAHGERVGTIQGPVLQKDDVIQKPENENAWWNPSKKSATSKHPVTVSGFSILIPLLFYF